MVRDGIRQDIDDPARPQGSLPREGKSWRRRGVPLVLWRRIGLVALLALASLGGMAAIGLSLIHDAARAEIARDAAFIAKLVRTRVYDMAEDGQTLLRVLAASPEVPGPGRAACDRRLVGLMALPELRQRYTGIIVLTGDLVPVCSSFDSSRLRRIQDLGFLREAARRGGFVLGDYRVGEASGAAIMPAALAFRPADRQDADHLIAIGIRFAALQQTLAEFVLPPNVGIFVLDSEGRVVAARHPQGPESWLGRSVAGSALWQAAGAQEIGTYRGTGFDGTPRIAAFRQVSPEPGRLRVVATYPQDEALRRMFGDIRSGLSWLTASFVLVVLVLLAGGYLLVLRYVERVAQAGCRLIEALPAVLPEGQVAAAAPDLRTADLPQISDAVAQALLYLRQREADLELSQRLAGVTSWRWSRGQGGITVSASFREALGLPAGLALPATLADYLALVPPEEREGVEAGLRGLFRRGEPLDLEHRMVLPDGHGAAVVRDLILRGRPLPVEDGKHHFVGALQDVTDLRALQRAYARERTFLRTLLDSMDEGVLACDAEGMLVYGNRKEEEFGGPLKPVHVDEFAAAYNVLEADGVTPLRPEATVLGRALKGLPVDGVTVVQATRNRQRRTLRITGRPIVDRGGVLLGGMIIQQDLTELQAERDAVQDREAEFRQIFEAAHDGNLVLLPDGEILLANAAARRMLGIAGDDLHGRRLPEAWAFLDEERMHRLAGAAAGEAVRLELEASPPGRPELLLDLTASPMRFRGRWAILLVARDITARRETEEKLRGIQRLEVVGRLAGGIAHDFNNLLQIVILNLDLLAMEAQGSDQAGQAVEAALEAALRGSELTQQLLTHSMQQSLEPRVLELGAAVRSARPLLSRLLGPGIALREAVSEHAAWVTTDPVQLDLALSHLALNAREAMTGEGTLTIGTALVRFENGAEELPPGNYALLSVSDDGAGMSEEVRRRAFEPFFTTRPAGQGSGLGLSMVFGFMRQCGGTAFVESAPGRGTTITLCFPQAAPPVEHSAAMPDEQTAPAAGRVLVVEDDEAVRMVLCRHLAELGWATVAAARAEEALARLSAENGVIALVLSDITMPGAMNGIDLAWEIRRRWPDLPVLLASGHAGGAEAGLPPGMRLLRKPFRLARLREAIEEATTPHRAETVQRARGGSTEGGVDNGTNSVDR